MSLSPALGFVAGVVLLAGGLASRGDALKGVQQSETLTIGTNRLKLRAGPGCSLHRSNDVVMLFGDGALLTEKTFRPPFTIHAVASTDITNLRLYWGSGMVIFNWELNPRELRFHEPNTGRVHAFGRGMGFLTVDQWHDVQWVVNPDSNRILVDGEERAFGRSNNAGLTNAVGIGPSRGSIVTVKLFDVEKVELP